MSQVFINYICNHQNARQQFTFSFNNKDCKNTKKSSSTYTLSKNNCFPCNTVNILPQWLQMIPNGTKYSLRVNVFFKYIYRYICFVKSNKNNSIQITFLYPLLYGHYMITYAHTFVLCHKYLHKNERQLYKVIYDVIMRVEWNQFS